MRWEEVGRDDAERKDRKGVSLVAEKQLGYLTEVGQNPKADSVSERCFHE